MHKIRQICIDVCPTFPEGLLYNATHGQHEDEMVVFYGVVTYRQTQPNSNFTTSSFINPLI